ncbi:MAG: hypothetical protein MZV65_35610 [Chromatiales bacterium]|nr:hypothetical protein [Chromatiales bacterium]
MLRRATSSPLAEETRPHHADRRVGARRRRCASSTRWREAGACAACRWRSTCRRASSREPALAETVRPRSLPRRRAVRSCSSSSSPRATLMNDPDRAIADAARPARRWASSIADRRLRHRLLVASATCSRLPVDTLKIDRTLRAPTSTDEPTTAPRSRARSSRWRTACASTWWPRASRRQQQRRAARATGAATRCRATCVSHALPAQEIEARLRAEGPRPKR